MHFPQDLSPERFLDTCWQKRPLHLPAAFADIHPQITGDELAWLATLDDVESRLVFTERSNDSVDYRVRHGPFDEHTLRNLPEEDCTLLVQDVEKHLPDFRVLINAFDFIPDWRIDDLMVSYAAPGGGVGPHRDDYDVFLCQGTGTRRWRIARCDEHIPDRNHDELRLLAPFEGRRTVVAARGDVLYLPPGVPHWGIAIDRCLTYSIGMRAPTVREIADALGMIADVEITIDDIDPDTFYTDHDLEPHEAEPGMISARSLERLQALLPAVASRDPEQLAVAFGVVVTRLKDWLRPDPHDAGDREPLLTNAGSVGAVPVHGMSRLAWCQSADARFVFANGTFRAASDKELSAFRDLCRKRAVTGDRWRFLRRHGGPFLDWLLQVGVLDFAAAEGSGNRPISAPKNVT